MAPIFTGSRFGFGRVDAPSGPSFSATGGTKYSYGGKTIHVFTSTDATGLVITGGNLTNVEYVMVGGGGGGGANYAGGGGAGGYLTGTFSTIPGPGGPYPVTIGAAGNAQPSPQGRGGNGSNTVFNGTTAYGGGGGGFFNGGGPDGSDGTPGASGGGAGGSNVYQTLGGTGNRIAGTSTPIPAQGNSGAQGFTPQFYSTGGSGGGAGAAAAAPFDNGGAGHDASPGGIGLQAPPSFRDPTNPYGTPGPNPGGFYFAGGGGAAYTHGAARVPGGAGGGGAGAFPPGSIPAAAGSTNTGGGGGGNTAAGGSGIVMIAY